MKKTQTTPTMESNMRWAIALALEGEGMTSPNPIVGAVIVRDDKIVGEGFHAKAGAAHAEVNAIADAGKLAKGADLYVTLEPCCNYGRTPPCVDAILKAGIKRVFVGTLDPNPAVSGRGVAMLRSAGVKVSTGVLEISCRKINESYNKFIVTGRPFVTLKAAVTLDGKIATSRGQSKWITNEQTREYVHRLRMTSDAILVGRGTVEVDDPMLTVRIDGYRGVQPYAVIVDEFLSTKPSSSILRKRRGTCIFAVTKNAPRKKILAFEKLGHKVVVCRADSKGRVLSADLLKQLGKLEIKSVIVEGGAKIFSDFVSRGLADKVVVCLAPKFFGGKAMDFLPDCGVKKTSDAISLDSVSFKTFGDNVVVEGYLSLTKSNKAVS